MGHGELDMANGAKHRELQIGIWAWQIEQCTRNVTMYGKWGMGSRARRMEQCIGIGTWGTGHAEWSNAWGMGHGEKGMANGSMHGE